MYKVTPYERPNGSQPVRDWLNELKQANPKGAAKVHAKIQKLREEPLQVLLGTKMVEPIRGADPDFYELRPMPYRVLFHHDPVTGVRTLLWSFKKEGDNERQEIERGRSLLREFIAMQSQPRR